MYTSDSKVTKGPILEIKDDLRSRMEKALPERVARYGLKEKDFSKLRSLTVGSSLTLSAKDKKSEFSKDVKQIRVKSFERLREILGTHSEIAPKIKVSEEHTSEARNLIEQLKNYRPQKNDKIEIGARNRSFRRLAQLYLYQMDPILAKESATILGTWRFPISLYLAAWWDIVVEAGQTLTIAANIHTLWAYRIILHPGAKIKALGSLRIDAHTMESY